MWIFKKRFHFPKYCKYFEKEITQLKSLGYHSVQIKEIICNSAGSKPEFPLSNEEIDRIRGKLRNHIDFARKALKSNNQ